MLTYAASPRWATSILMYTYQYMLCIYQYTNVWHRPAYVSDEYAHIYISVYILYTYISILTYGLDLRTSVLLDSYGSMSAYACIRYITYADVCRRMLAYTCVQACCSTARVQQRPTYAYAGVCWRMLMYAGVCRRAARQLGCSRCRRTQLQYTNILVY